MNFTNTLWNDVEMHKSEDIHCFTQLLNLIIHLELGNQRLVTYALKSTQRYLITRNRVYKFETIVMNFINQILKLKDKENEIEMYKDLQSELKPLAKRFIGEMVFE